MRGDCLRELIHGLREGKRMGWWRSWRERANGANGVEFGGVNDTPVDALLRFGWLVCWRVPGECLGGAKRRKLRKGSFGRLFHRNTVPFSDDGTRLLRQLSDHRVVLDWRRSGLLR